MNLIPSGGCCQLENMQQVKSMEGVTNDFKYSPRCRKRLLHLPTENNRATCNILLCDRRHNMHQMEINHRFVMLGVRISSLIGFVTRYTSIFVFKIFVATFQHLHWNTVFFTVHMFHLRTLHFQKIWIISKM